jgi:hypothetical protein
LINSDGGSDDNTPAIVRGCSVEQSETVTASHGLRTSHRISAPYHGIPGKGSALRQILAAADLLQADVVVVLDPEVSNVTPEWIAALAKPIWEDRFDFAAPLYVRHSTDGLLVTQLLRPLIGAVYGWRVREPLAGEFGCSGRFAAHCVNQEVWDAPLVTHGIDLWLTGTALAASFKTCQTWLGPRQLASNRPSLGLQEMFQQIVSSAFETIELHSEVWTPRSDTQDVPIVGAPPQDPAPAPAARDGSQWRESLARDATDLADVLRAILTPTTFAAVEAAADIDGPAVGLSAHLWAATVCEFLVAYHRSVMRRDHITQALLPLYRARTGTFLSDYAAGARESVDIALESLCVEFERRKGGIVERWNSAG